MSNTHSAIDDASDVAAAPGPSRVGDTRLDRVTSTV
jgi:hypothetical protein